MKSILPILMALFFTTANAQEFYTLEHIKTNEFGFENMPALKIVLNNVDKELAMKQWEKFLKKNKKAEMLATENSVVMKRMEFPKITAMPIDIFSNFKNTQEGVELLFAFRDTVKNIDVKQNEYGFSLENKINEYLKTTYLEKLDNDVETEEKHLSALEKEAKNEQKNIDKSNKKILNLEGDISNRESEIEANQTAYSDVLAEVKSQEELLARLSKKDESYKPAKQELDMLEKRKDNLEKDTKKLQEKNFDASAEIEELKKEISVLEEQQASSDKKVSDQRQKIILIQENIYKIKMLK